MKIKSGLALIVAGCALSLNMVSCKKDNASGLDTDTSTASDNNLAEGIYNDVQNMSDQADKGDLTFYYPTVNENGEITNEDLLTKGSSCATITRDTVSSPRTITIDFGTSNCVCKDGRSRKGKILISYQGKYRDSASVHTITFDNYFVDDNQVLGSKTVTNNGHNSNGNLNYTINVSGSVIKANNGGTVTYSATKNREWIEGENTLTWIDDVYLITGNASGTNANGISYTATITTALQRALSCKWFESGVIEITPSGKATRTINYGNTGCDALATVTINGKSYPITLK